MGNENFKINDNCDDLMIWHFDKAVSTSNLKYIQHDFNDDIPLEVLYTAWAKIIAEYELLTGDVSQSVIWNLRLLVERLKLRFIRVAMGLNILFNKSVNDENKQKIVELLKSDNVLVGKLTEKELKRLNKQLQSMKTKISLKEQELKRLLPKEDAVQTDLDEQLYNIEKITDAKYKIDAKQTSVKRYLTLIKETKKIVERNGKR